MKKLFLLAAIAVFFMSGCASLQNAGNAHYSMHQSVDAKGNPTFDLDVVNGKEIASVEAHVAKDGDKFNADLKEQGVAAFAGQQISADAMKVAVDGAVKAAVAAALAPVLPSLVPVVGAVGASGGLGAAAVGAGAVLGVQKMNAPVEPAK